MVGLGLGAVVEDVDAAGFWLLYCWNGLVVAIVRWDRGSPTVCVYLSDRRAGADRTERTNWGTAMFFAGVEAVVVVGCC